MASESLLESVAQHETALMKELDQARESAREIIEAAHTASATHQQELNSRLEEEVASMRKDAAQKRESERKAIEKNTADNVDAIRSAAAGRTDSVRDALVARILPGNAG